MGGSGRVWGALVLEIPSRMEERVIAGLAAESLGAELLPVECDRILVKVYLDSDREASARVETARVLLERLSLDPAECKVRVERVADGRWAERFQEGLKPFAFGSRFVVHPAGREEPEDDRIAIRLVPGRAFGTGEHPTTRLCARQLEQRVQPGDRWVDLGCGSAILCIVAHHCGARTIVGVDNDREAVDVAREVLRENGLSGSVTLTCATADSLTRGVWDGVVANIGAGFFVRHAGAVAGLLRPGGLLVASGFTESDVPELEPALLRAGLAQRGRESEDGWSVVSFLAEAGRRG